jgi:hypothetical protein
LALVVVVESLFSLQMLLWCTSQYGLLVVVAVVVEVVEGVYYCKSKQNRNHSPEL